VPTTEKTENKDNVVQKNSHADRETALAGQADQQESRAMGVRHSDRLVRSA